jgi:hypothetical protein
LLSLSKADLESLFAIELWLAKRPATRWTKGYQ